MKLRSQPHKGSRISGSLLGTANRVLAELGSPTEICALVAKVLVARPLRMTETLLGQEVYKAAKTGEQGLVVETYPSFKLMKNGPRIGLPRRGYLAAASMVMSSLGVPRLCLDIREVARQAREAGFLDTVSPVPEYWMYVKLREYPKVFSREGSLTVGLMDWRQGTSARIRAVIQGAARRSHEGASLGKRIYERDLESLICERLQILENGLELIERQYSTPVGRIDLLCKDGRGNFVIVELKSFGGRTSEIIDQITRYMGYIKTHLATARQLVRGIIVAGKVEDALSYAVVAIPNLEVRTFDVSIIPAPSFKPPKGPRVRQQN